MVYKKVYLVTVATTFIQILHSKVCDIHETSGIEGVRGAYDQCNTELIDVLITHDTSLSPLWYKSPPGFFSGGFVLHNKSKVHRSLRRPERITVVICHSQLFCITPINKIHTAKTFKL